MRLKTQLTKLAGLGLLLSGSVQAGQLSSPLFELANGHEQLKAQTENMVAAKASVDAAFIYKVKANVLSNDTQLLQLNLAPGLTVYANKQSAGVSASGGLVWQGDVSHSSKPQMVKKPEHIQADTATLINRKGKITGTVRVDGRLFKIQPLANGLHQVLEINEDNMKPDHPPGAMAELEQQLKARLAKQPQLLTAQLENNLVVDPVIRVMVLYTNGVSSEVADIPGLIDLAFTETNQGYVNSGVNATVELAHLGSINYNSNGISSDLTRLKDQNDGYMDSVHGLRDTHGADVVMLIVPDSGSSCGKAGAIGAVESTAFAVTAQDCATGYYSFGHELGHLQSARHNPETDSSTTPYAFGHGYRDPSSNWRTVMAYNCSSGCSRINWWSNPNNSRSGTPMGTTSTSDNTRVLNLTSATVAGFRGDGTPPPPTGTVELTNGVAVNNLSGAQGEQSQFSLDVPAGATNLSFSISGGSGDADMYTRFGAVPTTSTYDCRPYVGGNNETCTPSTISTGSYYIMLNGYSAYSGVSLVGSYDTGSNGGSMNESNLAASQGDWLHYSVSIPSAMSTLSVDISGGSGDADLYVRRGSQATTSTYDCRPYKNGNSENCTVDNPAADTWHISLRAYSTFSGVSLTANWN